MVGLYSVATSPPSMMTDKAMTVSTAGKWLPFKANKMPANIITTKLSGNVKHAFLPMMSAQTPTNSIASK
ncbi:hypothetical protein THIOM_002482 [Candidatus Thiomargarita nelsonii]|uniref:Uncharacterized protein n=1 Tax=Candidatus Thiomargarita nelsonii TaxID=1003181 RepID=A0A176S1A2_9GAMM|nr:hypothetical protein THIOM_002482 [Candidatus Thiomargarita nelsonii]